METQRKRTGKKRTERMAAGALALLALFAPLPARAGEGFAGCFGAEFGSPPLREELRTPLRGGDGIFGGLWECRHVPPAPWPEDCARWTVRLAPLSRRVVAVEGLFPLPPGADPEEEFRRTASLFGTMTGAAGEETDGGGRRFLSANGNRVEVRPLPSPKEALADSVVASSPRWEEEARREERQLEAEEAERFAAELAALAWRPESVFGIAFGGEMPEDGPVFRPASGPFFDCGTFYAEPSPATGKVKTVGALWVLDPMQACLDLYGKVGRLVERATGGRFGKEEPWGGRTARRMEVAGTEIFLSCSPAGFMVELVFTRPDGE